MNPLGLEFAGLELLLGLGLGNTGVVFFDSHWNASKTKVITKCRDSRSSLIRGGIGTPIFLAGDPWELVPITCTM